MVIKEKINAEVFWDALTIIERYQALRGYDLNLDESALKKWRNRKSILSDQSFATMLEKMDYNKAVFSHCISDNYIESPELFIDKLQNSEWFTIFNDSMELVDQYNFEYREEHGFSYIVRPFYIYLEKALDKEFVKYKPFVNSNVIRDVINNYTTNAIQIAHKSLVLELNVSRLRNQLIGETPEERFHSFNRQFVNKSRLIEFYSEYKVLARILTNKLLFTLKNTLEFLDRFLLNKDAIYKRFNINPEDVISTITPGEGDSHQQGRTVIRIEFKSDKKVVYKPRNIDIGVAYHEFINWLNEHDEILDMQTYNILNFKNYSFEEFVEKNTCTNLKEVEDFYVRFGQLLAIMHLLNGTDMHMENIIAKGSVPVIVDFETLLHTPIPFNWPDSAYVKASYESQKLVSNTMLLPTEIKDNLLNKKGIDLSGLNGKAQKIPYKVQGPINRNTDEMTYSLIDATMEGANNLPELNGEVINYTEYIDHIVKGFRDMSELFIKYKDELIKENGVLSKFKGIQVRIIARGTSQYFNMINQTYHPDYLRNSLHREQILENIWAVPYKSKAIITSEYKDMLNDDIPIFFNITDTNDLIDSNGKIYKNIFENSSYELLIDKIKSFDEQDMNKQISVIYVKTGYYAKDLQKKAIAHTSNLSVKTMIESTDINLDKEAYLAEATRIGEEILSSAIYSEDQNTISWLSIETNNGDGFDIIPIKGDFYDGLSGLLLFYHNLYKLTKNKKFKNVRDILFTSALERVQTLDTFSSFTGKASLLYPLSQMLLDNNNPQYRDTLYKIVKELEENMDSLHQYDWIGGTTGIIHLLINLFEELKNPDLLILSIKMGNKLLTQLNTLDLGLVGGFSHGASAISFVLIRLGNLARIEKFKEKGLELLSYDRSLYSTEFNGWLDITSNEAICRHQWCHGSEGIGLSRLLLKNYYKDDLLEEEIDLAIKLTLNSSYKNDDCLCHGNLGTTELFLSAYENTKDIRYYNLAEKLAGFVMKEAKNNGSYQTRAISNFPILGMFTGLAGIGYQLLRIADPENVPSILSLSLK